eukprot:scaffold330_cov246-Pinguiococcus_pyrenoidosus.AAC.20
MLEGGYHCTESQLAGRSCSSRRRGSTAPCRARTRCAVPRISPRTVEMGAVPHLKELGFAALLGERNAPFAECIGLAVHPTRPQSTRSCRRAPLGWTPLP